MLSQLLMEKLIAEQEHARGVIITPEISVLTVVVMLKVKEPSELTADMLFFLLPRMVWQLVKTCCSELDRNIVNSLYKLP